MDRSKPNVVVPPTMIYTSVNEMYQSTIRLHERIRLQRQDEPICLVGPARGVFGPARFFSDLFLVKPIVVLDTDGLYTGVGERKNELKIYEIPKKLERIANASKGWILYLDDVSDSGRTSRELFKMVRNAVSNDIVTCTLDYKTGSIFKPDYFDKEVASSTWIVYGTFELRETMDYLIAKKDFEKLALLRSLVREKEGSDESFRSILRLYPSLPAPITSESKSDTVGVLVPGPA